MLINLTTVGIKKSIDEIENNINISNIIKV